MKQDYFYKQALTVLWALFVMSLILSLLSLFQFFSLESQVTMLDNAIRNQGYINEALELEIKRRDAEIERLKLELEKADVQIDYDAAAVPTYDLPLDDDLQVYTYEMCSYYGIPEQYELVLATMWRESHFDASQVSATDDYGLMQINKINIPDLKDKLGIVDIMDEKCNIESGVYILSTLLSKYEDENKALMAYNMGPSRAAEHWSNGTYSSSYSRDVLNKAALIKLDEYSEK